MRNQLKALNSDLLPIRIMIDLKKTQLMNAFSRSFLATTIRGYFFTSHSVFTKRFRTLFFICCKRIMRNADNKLVSDNLDW